MGMFNSGFMGNGKNAEWITEITSGNKTITSGNKTFLIVLKHLYLNIKPRILKH
jgi:hypothetical protein